MTLARAQVPDIRLDDLSNGPGLVPFKLGGSRIISHDHAFLQEIRIDRLQQQVDLLKIQITDIANHIENQNFPYFSYQIKHLFQKLNSVSSQLDTFEPKRIKRGLINPLGTFIKSISGNLDHSDALRFENALTILQKNGLDMRSSFNKHISLYKSFTLQQTHTLENLSNNQQKLDKAIAYLANMTNASSQKTAHYFHLAQLFSILTENTQDLLDEVIRFENILAFSRTNSMHHSILSITELNNMISKLITLYGSNKILNIDIRNFYDIIKLGYYFIDKRIVIVLQLPIMSSQIYDFYRLCPVPNVNSEIILPPFPYIATNSQEFVYMEAECQKIDTWYICEQKMSHHTHTELDCIYHLLYHHELHDVCHPIHILLQKEALLQLDSQHYIISFPKKTMVQTYCEDEKHHLLEGSFLATIPRNCTINAPAFTIVNVNDKVRGHAVEIITVPKESTADSVKQIPRYNLTTIDLNKLHEIQHQVTMELPVKSESMDMSSVYHTTVPTYSIVVLSAIVLIIVLYLRQRTHTREIKITPTAKPNEPSTTGSPLSLQERRAATFALNIGK